ncbi:DUF6283 family protein [Nonomuraea thailandensis]|nr:DUF6283 family protein [Nonomuraea thailandensis]
MRQGNQRAPPARRPCGTCPYRKDAPSGMWSQEMVFDKLRGYDRPTFALATDCSASPTRAVENCTSPLPAPREALELNRPLGEPLADGRIRVARGMVHHRGGQARQAIDQLSTAISTVAGLDAPLWAARCGRPAPAGR